MIVEFKSEEQQIVSVVKTEEGLFLSFNDSTEVTQDEAESIIRQPSFRLAGANYGVVVPAAAVIYRKTQIEALNKKIKKKKGWK